VWGKRTGFRRVRKIAKSDYQRRHVCPSVCMSLRMNNSAVTGKIFTRFDVLRNFRKSFFFNVLLTVHLSIILATDQLNAQILLL